MLEMLDPYSSWAPSQDAAVPLLAGPREAGLPEDEVANREPAGTATLWRGAVPTAILPPDHQL
jgi:hypothetical protein